METVTQTKQNSRIAIGRGRDNVRRSYPYIAHRETAANDGAITPLPREFARKTRHVTGANGLVGGLIGAAIALFMTLNAASIQPWSVTLSFSAALLIISGTVIGSMLGIFLGSSLGRLFSHDVSKQHVLPVDQSDIVVTLRPAVGKRRTYFEQDATRSNLG